MITEEILENILKFKRNIKMSPFNILTYYLFIVFSWMLKRTNTYRKAYLGPQSIFKHNFP